MNGQSPCFYGHKRFICDSVCWGTKTLIGRWLALLEYIIPTQRGLIIWNIIYFTLGVF